jgi:diguanylate cyclase (GGDEF)-like protein
MHIFNFKKSHIIRTCIVSAIIILLIAGAIVMSLFPAITVKASDSEAKTVRVGWFDSAYCYKDQFGRRRGMAYEYQQKLVAYTGWRYVYVEGTWPELFQMLMEGDIDMLGDVSYTKERAENILYPGVPMGSESYYIFVRSGNTEMTLEDMSSFNGKIFAVDSGTVMETLTREWAENNGVEIDIRPLTEHSVDESLAMLENGEIDAYVTIDSYGDRQSCTPLCMVGSSDYYFAVSKDRPDLLNELNSALTNIQNEDPYYNQRLLQKYIWSANTNAYLTENELAWLSEHGPIRVGYRDNYTPFCTEDDGKLIGALGDFLAGGSTILKNAEIEFEPIAYANTGESLEALQKGEVDVVFPINLSPYDMENMELLSTEALMHTEIYAVVKPGNPKDIFNDEGVKAALLEGNVNFDIFVQDFYPQWTIEHKPNLEECYGAVARGDVDCAMVNGYRINKNDRLRRRNKLVLLATGRDMDFALAVNKGDNDLYAIINKIINLTDEAKVETDLSRYAGATEKITMEDYLYDNAPTAIAISVFIVLLILFLMLAKIHSDRQATERQRLISATELDPLTKLYTRNFFFEYATRMHNENPEQKMDAIVINIEQFHVINAIYGWDYGNKVLKALGDGIKAYLEDYSGIACRSQADRFDVYCTHSDDYGVVYDRLQSSLDEFSENVSIHIRVGIMPYSPDLGAVELFDRARTACGMVKGGRYSRLMVFSEEMREREILEQRLISDLKRALDQREFLVYYQPKYNVQVDPPVLQGAEALVRWKHYEIGMISPGEFITLFEKHGLIGMVDKYVWQEAARQIGEWKKKYGISLPVSVNLSRIDIFEPNLIKTIDAILAQNNLARDEIHLEVTESAYTEETDQIIGVVKHMRELGFVIEMDDFGTGYSSLNMLSAMPVDILKLDKSFIDNIEKTGGTEEKDIRLVELILDIAKSLKLKVVAEGVENEKQLNFLKNHGCEMVQGYYFSPPLPADEFEKKLF